MRQIATGWDDTLALLADGTLMAWGSNNGGTLGVETWPELCGVGEDDSGTNCSTVPVHVPDLADVTIVAVSAGGESSAALGPLLPAIEETEDEGEPEEGEPPKEEPPVEEEHSGEEEHPGGEETPAEQAERLREEEEERREEEQERREEEKERHANQSSGQRVAWGPETGGTPVNIKGTDLADATTVRFGGRDATFSVEGLGRISAIAPPGHGTVNITVTTPRGRSAAVRGDTFTYVPVAPPAVPTIMALSPKRGPSGGGTMFAISGTHLREAQSVSVGGISAAFEILSSTEVVATSPPGTAGWAPVSITTAGGSSTAAKRARFLYGPPVVSLLAPSQGLQKGGESVEISGSGFAPGEGGTLFSFRKRAAGNVDCTSTTRCTAVVPAGAKRGAVKVTAKVGKTKGKRGVSRFVYQ